MKKNVFVSVLFCCLSLMAQAQVAKYCMTYADFVADVASFFVCKPVRLGLNAGSTALWICRDHLNSYVCYLIDSDTDSKGRTPVTRINDKFMEQLLTNDTAMLAKYNAISSKKQRQSASNVLPILMEKGLVASNAIN